MLREDRSPMITLEQLHERFKDVDPCRCNCGYTCDRTRCALPIMECIRLHYKKDCDHKWDGPAVDLENGWSVTCSKCGMLASSHDCLVGP